MKIFETFKTSVRALNLNKGRSFLTMLGVIIGVYSVVVLVSIGKGLENYLTDEFDSLGSNLLFLAPGKLDFTSDPGRSLSRNQFESKHIDLINTYAGTHITALSPYIESGATATYRNRTYFAGIMGANHQYDEVMYFELIEGSSFTRSDVITKSRVAVIGPTVSTELFSNRSPVGHSIRLENDTYRVIGTFKEKGRNFDDLIIIPYTSASETLSIRNFSSIVMKVDSPENIEIASKQVERALLRDLKEDEFTVFSQQDILSAIQNILQIFTLALSSIAGISLLVGGIGIMNIMLVSVTERTREIGLRKALGATSNNIAVQFLIESILLSIGGGLIGLTLGWLTSLAGRFFLRTEIPLWSVLLAFSFSVLVGVLFGTYPALKASKKDPIEALRYE
jgi:putative ABC transport system permease protein